MIDLSKFRNIVVVLMVLLFSIQPSGYVYPAESQHSESLINTMAWVLTKGAAEGADAFLKSTFSSTWDVVKAALTPAAQVLMSRYPGFKEWWENPPGRIPSRKAQEAANRAAFNVLSDPELQQLIIKEFDKLEQGQKQILNEISALNIDFRDFAATQEKSLEEMKAMLSLALGLIEKQEKNSRTNQIDEYWLSGTWAGSCERRSSLRMYIVDSPGKVQQLTWATTGEDITDLKRYLNRRHLEFSYDLNGNNIIFTEDWAGPTGRRGHVKQRIKVVDHDTLMFSGTCYIPRDNSRTEWLTGYHGLCKDGWDTGSQLGRDLFISRCEAGTRLY